MSKYNIKGKRVGHKEWQDEWQSIKDSLKNGPVKIIKPLKKP